MIPKNIIKKRKFLLKLYFFLNLTLSKRCIDFIKEVVSNNAGRTVENEINLKIYFILPKLSAPI